MVPVGNAQRCPNHPQRSVSSACVHCGRLFCDDCFILSGRKHYCKQCAAERLQQQGASTSGIVITQQTTQQTGYLDQGDQSTFEPSPSPPRNVFQWVGVAIYGLFSLAALLGGQWISWSFLSACVLLMLPQFVPYLEEKKLSLHPGLRGLLIVLFSAIAIAGW